MPALLAILGNIVGFAVREAKTWISWAKQKALVVARNLRALLVWATAHTAARVALVFASVAAFEAFTLYVATSVVTPLANGFIRLCIPPGSAGDGIVWMLWDSGLNGKAIFTAATVYLANYTALWRAFDVWLRAQAIALSTYRAAVRRAKAVQDSSILT